jgi:H+/gluconate symporter-like permease
MIIEFIGVFIPIILFCAIAIVLWKYFEGRHKERMAMIDKGVNPAEFKSAPPFRLWQGSVLSNLKWGLLAVFAGIGLLAGQQLEYYFGFHEESAVFGSILIAGGLALIIFYLIAARKLKEKQEVKE